MRQRTQILNILFFISLCFFFSALNSLKVQKNLKQAQWLTTNNGNNDGTETQTYSWSGSEIPAGFEDFFNNFGNQNGNGNKGQKSSSNGNTSSSSSWSFGNGDGNDWSNTSGTVKPVTPTPKVQKNIQPKKVESPRSSPASKSSSGPVSEEDKKISIQAHNRLRNSVATQTTSLKKALPFAKNMRQVYWSEEIAAKAQEWANNKKFEHSPRSFRNIPGIGQLGENLAIHMTSISTPHKDWNEVVEDWFGEIKDYNTNQGVKNFSSSGHRGAVGHFTQVIWADTYLVGCGYSTYIEDGMTTSLYVCQYAPAGNYIGEPIYLPANSPSDKKCPEGTSASSKDYQGLCCISNKCSKNDYKL